MVTKTTGSWHTVKDDHQFIHCRLKGNFRIRNLKNTNPVAVGDYVSYEITEKENGVITHIHDRKNYIIRKSTNLSKESQILAANIDQVLLMFTLDYPETPLEFVDRFLVSAEAYHIPCHLLVNKTDLYNEQRLQWLEDVKSIYQKAGYQVYAISVKTGEHMSEVYQILQNKLSLIAGNSGIGKSSFINYFCPELHLKTNDISWYHESGKHTTTYPEMVSVNENSFIIDSPGIRGFGITDLDKNEIGLYFTDIFRLSKDCSFYNCTHIHEPGCAVMQALENGDLHESRYRSYHNIFNDSQQKYRNG